MDELTKVKVEQQETKDVLQQVMFQLNSLPCCSQDFLGEELYGKVAKQLGYDGDDE